MRTSWYDVLLICLIIIAGSLALLFKIGDVPPLYPWSDESEVAADAVGSLDTGLQWVYPIQRSGGAMGVWLETGWMALFGKGLLGLRVFNGLLNLIAAVLLYLLVLELPFEFEPDGGAMRRWLAFSAGLLFAVSTWLLGLGRIATPNWSAVAVLTPLAFYLFWRGLNTGRRWYAAAAGGVMGLFFYGYLPGYLVPVVVGVFLLSEWVVARGAIWRLSLWALGAMMVVAGPILVYFALNPIAVLNRPMQVMDTGELSEGGSMIAGGLDTLSTFGFWPNWLVQGRFADLAFDPLVTALFVAGVVMAVWHWRVPAYRFVLVWWAVLISPAVLSGAASAGFIFEVWRRGVGAQPVSFIFPALAVVGLGRWLQQRWPGSPALKRAMVPATLGIVIVISAGFSYRLYFQAWANSGIIPSLFAQSPVRMVEWMEATGDDGNLFLFPLRPNVSYTTRPELFTVRYLYDGPAKMAFPVMDEAEVGARLGQLFAEQPAAVTLMMSDRVPVDPKGYFEYVLGAHGTLVSRETLPGYNVSHYQLRTGGPVETRLEPVETTFGEALRLSGQAIQPAAVAAGQTLGVALRWAKVGPQMIDYNVQLALADRQGYEVVRVDKPLLSAGDYLTTRHWAAGTESTVYFALPVPPDAPPGLYTLRVVAYEVETGRPLPPAGGEVDLSLTLAEIALQPNPVAVDPGTLAIAQPLETQFPGGLRLIGMESSAGPINHPGDRLRVTLVWQATSPLPRELGLILALAKSNAAPIPLFKGPQPLITGYPTTEWPVGHIYRINYTMLLPAKLATNKYALALRLVDLKTSEPLAEQLLAPLDVEARPHIFDMPALAHQVNNDFGGVIRLLGYEPGAFTPGQPLTIKLQWQALQEVPESYKLFVHLIDGDGQIVSQVDTLPQEGAAPTTGWVPGEIIEDAVMLPLPAEVPAGGYRVVMGLYDAQTGRRLLAEGQDQVVLVEATE